MISKSMFIASLLFSSVAHSSPIIGSWVGVCRLVPDQNEYQKDHLTIGPDTIDGTVQSYEDPECSEISPYAFTVRSLSSYSIGESIDEEPGASEYNHTIIKIMFKINDPAIVKAVNESKLCGGGWQLDVFKEVTEALCNIDLSPNPGDIIYSAIKIENSRLLFSNGDGGQSPDDRVLEFEGSLPYTRVN